MIVNDRFYYRQRALTEDPLPKTVLNKTTIASWVNALKGKYRRRGNRELLVMYDKQNGAFSALGVLCDLVDPNGWDMDEQGYLWHGGYLTIPNPEFLQQQGIPESLGRLVDTLNYEGGKSLGAIANYLERRYLKRHKSYHRNRRGVKAANRIHSKLRIMVRL